VVIPKAIRDKLYIDPKTKLLVYGYDDGLIMKKMKVQDSAKELKKLFKKIDSKTDRCGELSEEEIQEIVQRHRRNKAQRIGFSDDPSRFGHQRPHLSFDKRW
jgi:bifunctional DNA-binding transcriptional regulator/antitoxin component of YhaV-PrlF toxin-antitoxin module